MGKNKAHSFTYFIHVQRKKIATAVALSFLASVCHMIPYFAIAAMVSQLLSKSFTFQALALSSIVALMGFLGQVLFSALSTSLSHACAFEIVKDIRLALMGKFSRVCLGDLLRISSGKIKTLFVDTVEKIELPIAHIIPEATSGLLVPLFILCYMFTMNAVLALVALCTLPIIVICYGLMTRDYENRYKKLVEVQKNMDASMVEYTQGIQVIKTFGQTHASYGKFSHAVEDNEAVKAAWFKDTNLYYIIGITFAPSILLGVLPVGAYLYMQGNINANDLILFIILSFGLIKPLLHVLEYTDMLAEVSNVIKNVSAMLSLPELSRPQEVNKDLCGKDLCDKDTTPKSTVEFKNVSFTYSTEKESSHVLQDISFVADPQQMLAIVGPSGSGKSTIAKLLASFWDVNSGEICIQGINIKHIPFTQLSQYISYVSQDNFLFNISIKDNLLIGNPRASDAEIIAACQKAYCHDFICKFEHGYDTLVGDAGGKLSGGERQRIVLARALLKNAPLIVLDEVTSFTDPENEAYLQKSICELVQNKTLIVIAHRLSTIKNAHKILVLNEGKVIAEGKHDVLYGTCEIYKNMWNAHAQIKGA